MANVYSINDVIPVVHPTAFVHPTAVLIGDAIVGPGCYVGPGASMRGDFGRVKLGEGCNLQDNCIMHSFPSGECVVEDNGHIGHGAVLHSCLIKKNALVGMNSVIMDFSVVGENSIIAAMSFVKAHGEIPSNILAGGVPAKKIRDLDEKELAWKVKGTEGYHELARRSLATLAEATPLTEEEPDRKKVYDAFFSTLKNARDGGRVT
ncbi:MAG: transferase hexapeptide repeat family protein [Rhodospirillales bacterium]|nr:transferase hexapeptide repeat family protein [Rhodospirillales bacterium]